MPTRSRRIVVPVTLERAGEEVEAEVVCTYHPGVPGCRTQRNGDPGWPDDPPEVEIEEVRRADREPTSVRDLTDKEVQRVEEVVFDAVEDA